MELKHWNRGLLVLVAMLLILAIIATVNIIIHQYSTEKMEFGSWSDWFNTAGTLGTFAIAAMAYRKAPDWIKQKHYDAVYKIIEEAVYTDLPTLNKLCMKYKSFALGLGNAQRRRLTKKNHDFDFERYQDDFKIMDDSLISLFNLSYSIQNRLNSIKRNNYFLSDYANDLINEIKNIADELNWIHTGFELMNSEVDMLYAADQEAIEMTLKEIQDAQMKIINLNRNFSFFVNKVFTENKSVNDYIRPAK